MNIKRKLLGFFAAALLPFTMSGTADAGLNDGLAGYWTFDEGIGIVANDVSGNGNTGAINGGATFAPGHVNTGLYFNGASNVVVQDSLSLNPSTSLTISAFVQPSTSTGDIVTKDGENAGGRQYQLTFYNSHFWLSIGTTTGLHTLMGNGTWATGGQYHVAMTYDGATVKLFVNGALDGSLPVTGAVVSGNQPVRIGGGAPAGQSPYWFSGGIDEVKVYARALADCEVARLAGSTSQCLLPAVQSASSPSQHFELIDPELQQDIVDYNYGGVGTGWTSDGRMLRRVNGEIVEYSAAQSFNVYGTDMFTRNAYHAVSGLPGGNGLTNGTDGYLYANSPEGLYRVDPNNWAATRVGATYSYTYCAAYSWYYSSWYGWYTACSSYATAQRGYGNNHGIGTLPDGRIVRQTGNDVWIYNPADSSDRLLFSEGSYIDDLTTTSTGLIALASIYRHQVVIIDANGAEINRVNVAGYTGAGNPDGMAFGGGSLYTAATDGTVSRFDFTGPNFTGTASEVIVAYHSGGYGDLSQVGPDGAFYVTQNHTRYDDGSTTGGWSMIRLSIPGGFDTPPGVPANKPPVANAGAAQTVESTGATTAVTLDGSVSSDPDGDVLSYAWSWNGGSATGVNPTVNLANGTYAITLTVDDGNGHQATATTTVTVQDTIAPAITIAPIPTMEATSVNGALVDVAAYVTTTDVCAVSMNVSPSGPYALGTSTVTVTATDCASNTSSQTVDVSVVDTTAPVLSVPANITAEATGLSTPIGLVAATATDVFPVTITSNAPGAFPLGTTPVIWTADDGNGNVSTGTQLVTVVDTTVPAITAPGAITVEANAVLSTVNIGTATASDIFSPVAITNDAPAGGFPLGTTTVTWTATDLNGNSSTAVQNVTVVDTTPPVMSPPDAPVNTPTLIDYANFCDLSNITLSGTSAYLNPAAFAGQCVLRLTNNNSQAGGGFVTNPVSLAGSASFSTAFSFNIHNPTGIGDGDGQGADGLVFVVQTQSNQYGGSGGGIGYAGIPNSVGIEFDTYNNGAGDAWSGNHVGIDINGNLNSAVLQPIGTRLNNGSTWHAWVDYNGFTKQLEVRLSQNATRPAAATLSYNIDLPAVLGQTNAFVGFTSGTGGGGTHDILNWQLTNTFAPISSAPGDVIVEANAVLSTVNIGTVTATDIFTPVTVVNDAPSAGFPLGTTQVTWTATDPNGNSSTATQNVTVVDTTPPTLSVPADVSIEANGVGSTVDIGTATGSDIFGVTITSNAPATFPLGTTVVTWTATDGNGWTTTGTQKVTVTDSTAPVLTVPGDVSVEANAVLSTVSIGSATATDYFNVTITNNAPATYPLGLTVVTWTATDANGNASSATQNVTVSDTTAPVLTVPGDVSVEANAVLSTVTIGNATATDIFAVTITSDAPASYALGTTVVTWTATDANGNATSGTQNVTVVDTTAPVLNVPGDVSVEANGVMSTVSIGNATASDIFGATVSNDAPATFPLGTTTVTYTATDGNGLTTTGTQTVTVVDTTAPVLNVPGDVSVEANAVLSTVDIGVATASDIFGATVVNDAPATFPLGTTTVTYTATDGNGLTTTGTQTVTVVDTTAPVLNVPGDVSVEANAVLSTVDIGVATASDIFGATVSNDAPATFPLGTTTVTYTATDGNGLTTTGTQTVTVVDTTAPVLNVPANVSVEANAVLSTVDIGVATATDIFGATVVNDAPATFPLGTTTVTYTAKDGNGLTTTGTQTVTVVDTTAPVLNVPGDITAEANAINSTVAIGSATATDIFPVTVTSDAPATYLLGTTVVTWTATDANGNVTTGTQNVTVVDTTAPVLTVPADVSVEATGMQTPVSIGTATATDIFAVTVTSDAPATYPLGTTVVTWTATDANGNVTTGTQNVTVVDTTAPTVTAQLVPVVVSDDDDHHGKNEEHAKKGLFQVVFTASDIVDANPALTATLNGATVTNGQIVQLKQSKKAEVEFEHGKLQVEGMSFTLDVSATDFSGNTGTASASYAFPVHEDHGIHRGNDKEDKHADSGNHKSEGKAKVEHKDSKKSDSKKDKKRS